MRQINFSQKCSQRGDTLVEVMVAISVLGMVVVGCMAIMNRSLSNMMNTIERTEVRTDINSQTEMLNYIRDSYLQSKQGGAVTTYVTMWADIQQLTATEGTSLGGQCDVNPSGSLAPGSTRPGSFYISRDATDGLSVNLVTTGRADGGRATPGDGLWVDAVRGGSGAGQVPYTDFYVKACWAAINGGVDQQTSTVVRLYDK